MTQIPIDHAVVRTSIDQCGIENVGVASIRALRNLVEHLKASTGVDFIHMEMGIPGLQTPSIAVEDGIEAFGFLINRFLVFINKTAAYACLQPFYRIS